jgi:hypothetical protein
MRTELSSDAEANRLLQYEDDEGPESCVVIGMSAPWCASVTYEAERERETHPFDGAVPLEPVDQLSVVAEDAQTTPRRILKELDRAVRSCGRVHAVERRVRISFSSAQIWAKPHNASVFHYPLLFPTASRVPSLLHAKSLRFAKVGRSCWQG